MINHSTDSDAKWVWLPSQRTLANTFVLFRRQLVLPSPVIACCGFIFVDSRYRLFVNGRRVQFGPAPCDPRWQEADPLNLKEFLNPRENLIGVETLFYGHGDGTWPTGKPGLIFDLQVECVDGSHHRLISDANWQCRVDRSHRPGGAKRWYLRALQEQCDNRLAVGAWLHNDYACDANWVPAAEVGGQADRPSICSNYSDYATDAGTADAGQTSLTPRTIPMPHEELEQTRVPAYVARIHWQRSPDDWFDFRMPGSWSTGAMTSFADGVIAAQTDNSATLVTYDFTSDKVAWPVIDVDAPAGTIIELLWCEAHDTTRPGLSDGQFFAWTRLICREGINHFEAFDFECFRWLQLHVRGNSRAVKIVRVARRTRRFPWPQKLEVSLTDRPLQRLLEAVGNTLDNSAQETCVDGMARERQQYSGDCGHQLQAIRFAFGEMALPARFLKTWSQGMTHEGYFLDCWPAYDRMNRVAQRMMGLTHWGPILDHGVGFNFDCWHHYLDTADKQSLDEPYPRLVKFARYLIGLRDMRGLIPVSDLGTPSVWIDHHGYRQQRHKQCAFNLYIAAAFANALAPMAQLMGETDVAKDVRNAANAILAATQQQFWHEESGLFINNLPWHREEGSFFTCDRSLSTAVLFAQCPGGAGPDAIRQELLTCPQRMGFSYAPNAIWRLRALARLGCGDAVVDELRSRWAAMPSVLLNRTLSEDWSPRPDGTDQWSHCPVAPLNVFYSDLLGLRPATPGFEQFELHPVGLERLGSFAATARTVRGPFAFRGTPDGSGYVFSVTPPPACTGVLHANGKQIPVRGGQECRVVLSAMHRGQQAGPNIGDDIL